MSDQLESRINLPLSTAMYADIQARAKHERMSAVAFIRKCISDGLEQQSTVTRLEKDVEDFKQWRKTVDDALKGGARKSKTG